MKRAPEYPGRFLNDDDATDYFARYFHWYDTEHYRSGIDYVTPQQAHRGQRQKIVDERREENENQESGVQRTTNHETLITCLVA